MQTLKQILATINRSVSSIAGTAQKKQVPLFNAILSDLKKLQTRGDNILNSIQNLNLINKIKVNIERLIIDENYQRELTRFVKSYDKLQVIHDEYFSQFAAISKKKAVKVIRDASIQTTLVNLTEAGLEIGVTNGIKKILQTNITAGASYADLISQLRDHIIGDKDNEGSLERYVKAYANTAINQFSAEYNKAIAEDLGLEWFMFDGSLLETSRDFCIRCIQKKYIHVSEFNKILKGDFDELGKIELSKKSGLPKGLMKGTNKDNLVRRRGGWNCGHQMIAVDEIVVPEEVKNKVYASAEYKTWAKAKGVKLKKPVITELPSTNFANNFKGKLNFTGLEKIKLPYSREKLHNLAGGIPSANIREVNVSIEVNPNGSIDVTNKSEDYKAVRRIFNKEKYIYNALMEVYKKGEGTGTNLLVNQIHQALELGFTELQVSAAKSDKYNGYYTWARMGYTMSANDEIYKFKALLKQHKRSESDLLELMSTAEGRKFWKEYGFWFEGVFDLQKGSKNLAAFNSYLKERGLDIQL